MTVVETLALQPTGVRDLGDGENVQKVKLVEMGLVPQSWKLTRHIAENTCVFTTAPPSADYDSDTHSGTYMQFSPAADSTRNGGGGGLWFWFHGKVLGLLVHWQNGYVQPRFTCEIDGIAYGVQVPYNLFATEVANNFTTGEFRAMVAEDLPSTSYGNWHLAHVTLPADTTVQRYMLVFGILVEARVGYQQPQPLTRSLGEGQLAVANGAVIYDVLSGISPSAGNRPGIRRIDYVNTDTVNRIVTITRGAGGAIRWQKTIAAGDTVSFDPGALYDTGSGSSTSTGGLYHYADAASKVNYTVIGDA